MCHVAVIVCNSSLDFFHILKIGFPECLSFLSMWYKLCPVSSSNIFIQIWHAMDYVETSGHFLVHIISILLLKRLRIQHVQSPFEGRRFVWCFVLRPPQTLLEKFIRICRFLRIAKISASIGQNFTDQGLLDSVQSGPESSSRVLMLQMEHPCRLFLFRFIRTMCKSGARRQLIARCRIFLFSQSPRPTSPCVITWLRRWTCRQKYTTCFCYRSLTPKWSLSFMPARRSLINSRGVYGLLGSKFLEILWNTRTPQTRQRVF